MKRKKFIKNISLGIIGALFLNNYKIKAKSKKDNFPVHTPSPDKWTNDSITLSWLGHSTVLINFYGKWILTDPVLLTRVGIYIYGGSIGPSRYTPPALNIDQIPKPDIVLLSHAHMDHMDYHTLLKISKKFPGKIDAITSFLTKDVIEDLPWRSLTELDWNDSIESKGIKIQAFETKHFGWRFPWEKDRSRGYIKDGRSYNAYLLTYRDKSIFFGGDTAFTNKWENISKINENKLIDIAIVPIGAYNPWKRNHCNPEEALIMADKMGAKYFAPIHCNTFEQSAEPRDEPINWLKNSIINYKSILAYSEIGDTFKLN